jgi:DNA-binding SARP family transcriptional activator
VSPVSVIRIEFFGGAKVFLDGHALTPFATTRAHHLFCFLALNRSKLYRREYLADLFWPDRAPAQGCGSLRTELWRIRVAFNKQRVPAALTFGESGHSVQFSSQAALSIDFETFDALLTDCREATRMDNLRAAAAMYKGELLAGIDHTWCTYHRELYRSRYLSVLEELIDRESNAGHWSQAIDLCIRFLIEDSFAEHIHCKLMTLYRQMGNRAAAIRQFELYRERLKKAFEIAPMPETTALFNNIVRDHPAPRGDDRRRPSLAAPITRGPISQALKRIRSDIARATDTFEYSMVQLDTPARNNKPLA